MKRVMSFLLAFLLTFSLFSMVDFQVFAAENDVTEEQQVQPVTDESIVLDSLSVSIVEPQIGMPFSQLSATAEGYATLVALRVYDGYTGELLEEGTFQEGYLYNISYEFKANEGYEFADWIYLSVDTDYSYSWGNNSTTADFSYSFQQGGQKISSIDLTIVEPVAGMSLEGYQVTVPEGAPYQITGWSWNNITEDMLDPSTFEAGNRYALNIQFRPTAGFMFADDIVLRINGKEARLHGAVDCIQVGGEMIYSLVENEQIITQAEVQITGLIPGNTPDDVVITIPEDAPYELAGYVIQDSETWDVIREGTFDEERSYYVFANFAVKPGSVFSENLVAVVNGIEKNPWVDDYGMHMECSQYFSFRIDQINLGYMPDYIEPGTAQIPAIDNWSDKVTISSLKWLDASKEQTVNTFVDGNAYYLELKLTANDSFTFPENWEPVIYFDNYYPYNWVRNDEKTVTLYFRYSLEPRLTEISVNLTQPEIGMNIADLDISTDGNVILDTVIVTNYTTQEEVTEGTLTLGNIYQISYILKPAEGYRFSYDLYVNQDSQNRAQWRVESEEMMVIYYDYSCCENIPSVEITATMPTPGANVADLTVSIPEGVPYRIEGWYWLNTDSYDKVEGTFEEGYDYRLDITLVPMDGYSFAYGKTDVTLNGKEVDAGFGSGGLHLEVTKYHSFFVEGFGLRELPYQIQPGTAEIPTVEMDYGDVTITAVKWLDSAKNKTVTTFQDGKVYYLAVYMKADDGKSFRTENDFYVSTWNEGTSDGRYLSQTEAVAYFRYSLEPDVGNVTITPGTLYEGMKVSDITAIIGGNAKLESISVVDMTNDWQAETESLKPFTNYGIYFNLVAKEGYRIGDNTGFEVLGGHYYNIKGNNDSVSVIIYFSTCTPIESVIVDIDDVQIGKNIEDIQVHLPADAPYEVTLNWYDVSDGWNDATGQFQDSHKYELGISVHAKENYILAKDVTITLNGRVDDLYPENIGDTASYWTVYSFLKPITRVDLPAAPVSIKKGQTLPTNFTVSDDAPYTLVAQWGLMDEGPVTTVSKNASYLLFFMVQAKPGYEFTEETVVYQNGKVISNYISSGGSDLQIYHLYNIGMNEIDRIDLTVPVPEDGKKPGEVTVPKGAHYALADVEFGYNADGSLLNIDIVTTFQKGTYIFIAPTLQAAEGYVFAEDVAVYINGQKMTSLRNINIGQIMVAYFGMGKVGDQVSPLTAPKVTVNGTTLTWEADPAAQSYEIYRSTSKSSGFKKIATVTDAQFVDSTAAIAKTYYYKVKAISPAGTKFDSGYSSVATVIYACAAPVIQANRDSATGKTVISWNKVSGAKSYEVWRATAVDGTYTKVATVQTTAYTDAKAAVGVEYYYKVKAIVATKSVYNSQFSGIYMSYAICARPVVKVTVDGPTGKPTLSWSKITSATGYRIYRKLPTDGDFVVIAEQTGTSFLDATAPLDTLCQYRVQAIGADFSCDSAYSDVLSASVALGIPTVKTSLDDGKSVLTWQAVEGAIKYEIYRSTSSYSKGYTLYTTVTEGTTFTDENVSSGKVYYYKVVASGEVSKSKESSYVKVTATCGTPTLAAQIDAATGKPSLSWDAQAGAKGYEIYRSVNGAAFKKLTTTKSTSYIDKTAPIGSSCDYKVRALGSKAAYNSPFGNIEGCLVICSVPTVKATVDTATGKPSLSWAKATGAVAYRIFRMLPGEEDFVQIAEITGTSYLDTSAPIDTHCVYRLITVGKEEGLNSAFTGLIEVTSSIAQPKVTTALDDGKPVLTWKAVEGATQYEIYRSTSSYSKGYTLYTTVTGTTFTDENVSAGKVYYYKVVASGEVSKSKESSYVKVTATCGTPTLAAQIDAATGKPSLSWDAQAGAKGYEIYRSVNGAAFKKLTTTKSTSYIDKSAPIGSSCDYKVRALGSKAAYNSPFGNIEGCLVICSAPTVKATVDTATGKPSLSWAKATGAVAYRIFRMLPGEEDFVQIAEITGTSYIDTSAPIDTLCVYRLITVGKEEGLNSAFTGLIEVTSSIAQPKLHAVYSPTPKISWKKVEGAVQYEIYRSTSATKGFTLIATVANTDRFTDESVSACKMYYYKVVAVGEVSKSKESAVIKCAAICAKPSSSASVDAATGKPKITWEKVSGAKSYTIYRTEDPDNVFPTKIGTSRTTSFVDTKAKLGVTYYYFVQAIGSSSTYNSDLGQVGHGVTTILPQPVATVNVNASGQPVLSWKKVSGAGKYIVIYMNEEMANNGQYMYELVTTTSFTLKTGAPGELYGFSVVAVPQNEALADIASSYSEPQYCYVTLPTPKLTGIKLSAEGKPQLSWDSTGVSGQVWVIYRSTSKNGKYEEIGVCTDPNGCIDMSAVKGKTYYYKIAVVYGDSITPLSNFKYIKSK